MYSVSLMSQTTLREYPLPTFLQVVLLLKPCWLANRCVAIDPATRTTGAILLWSIEIVMQQRIYALYSCSKKVAAVNATLFVFSIAAWFYIMIHNVLLRGDNIAQAVHLPLKGCPTINGGIEWALWIPRTFLFAFSVHHDAFANFVLAVCFEGVLFLCALFKAVQTQALNIMTGKQVSLYALLLRDSILYFFG